MGSPSLGQRGVADGIGTFFLVLIGPGAVMVDTLLFLERFEAGPEMPEPLGRPP